MCAALRYQPVRGREDRRQPQVELNRILCHALSLPLLSFEGVTKGRGETMMELGLGVVRNYSTCARFL